MSPFLSFFSATFLRQLFRKWRMIADSRPVEHHVIPIHITQLDFNGVKFQSAYRKIMDCGVILVQRFHLIVYFQMNSAEQWGKGVSHQA